MKLSLQFCLIFLLLSFSCTPEFEPNRRILVKGIVLNSEGQALSNYDVSVYTRAATGFFIFYYHENEYLLGSGKTAFDGSFDITALANRERNFSIEIEGQELYTDYIYATQTQNYVPNNSIYDLGTVSLKQKAVVSYSITRTSQFGTSINYSFSYENPSCAEVFEDGVLNPELSDCYSEQFMGNGLNDNNPNESGQFITTLGSSVTFNYSINEQPMISETFIVDQLNYTYEFTY